MQSIEEKVVRRIRGCGHGPVVTPQRFLDLGSRAAVVEKLRRRLSAADKEQLLRDIPLVPAWMGKVFREVAKGKVEV